MAEISSTLISGPFGSERVPVPELTAPAQGLGTSVVPDTEVLLDDAAMAAEPRFQGARQAREATANEVEPTVLETISAGVDTWITTRMVDRYNRPSFDNDTPINPHEFMSALPMDLSEDEREYILSMATGEQAAMYAVSKVRDLRKAHDTLGKSPIVGLLTTFADPLMWTVPPALRIGSLAGRAGRAASAVSSAGLAAGMTALGEGSVTDDEIMLSGIMSGAVAGVVFKGGKLVKADPDFPDEVLNAKVGEVRSVLENAAPYKYAYMTEPASSVRTGDATLEAPVSSPPDGYTRLYRADHPTVKFDDVFERDSLFEFKPKTITEGEFWTPDWNYADYFRETYNKGEKQKASIRYIDVPNEQLSILAEKVTPTDFVVDTSKLTGTPARSIQAEIPTLTERPKIDLEEAATIAETNIAKESKARGLGEAAQWNMRKTMSSFGIVGKKVADLIFDNNSDLSKNSLESIREAELSNLRTHQYAYEDLLRNEMAAQGFGTFRQVNPMTSRQAYAKQPELEKQLQLELFRRDQAARTGTEIPSAASPAIIKMADAVDANSKAALKNAKAAGVVGLEDVAERPGYLNRKWSSQAITDARLKLERLGLTAEQAHTKITRLVGSSIRRANNMEKDLANKIGAAIVDRALRKGYFEDALFNAPAGEGQLKQLRDILKGGGMAPADIERALNVLRVESDDAGKATFAKHRMELDYKATVAIGDTTISITDLIDSRVTSILDQYNRKVATSTAFARLGLKKPSDIEALRTELSHDIADEAKRAEAIRLFDNTIAYLRGEPSGATLNENFRLFQAYGRSISLAWSGLWQATEYATAMGEYGLLKTLKYAAQELPGLRTLMNNPKSAGQLNDVLAGHSMQSLRLRPYLARYEDGFEMTKFSAAQLSAQTVGDLVPMANAMKYVHHHQANMVGNLILDRVKMAVDGSADARKALATYGLEAPVMDRLAAEIKKHGFTVDAWDDAVWRDAQPAFAKMMDSAVLKERLGDVPAFAKFDDVGKILFTYRSFVLTAHNKVLAGTLARGGAGAVGLIMMYQFPLAMMAVQAQSLIKGDGALDDKDLAKRALGQMGGLGLFSEPIKWATGESNSVGAPLLIPADRAVRLFQSATNADAANASSTAITMLPVVAAVPFIRGVANQIKE